MDLKLAVQRLEDGFIREAKVAKETPSIGAQCELVQHEVSVASQLAHRAVELALLDDGLLTIRAVRKAAVHLLEQDEAEWRAQCEQMLLQEDAHAEEAAFDVIDDILAMTKDMIRHLKTKGSENDEQPPRETVTIPSSVLPHRDPEADGRGLAS